MSLLIKINNFLWRPFEIPSPYAPEKIEKDLSNRILIEPEVPLITRDKLYGSVGNGEFKIFYNPTSAILMRGAGKTKVRGRIERVGGGSRIYGNLSHPTFSFWLFTAIWVGLAFFVFKYALVNHEPIQWGLLFIITPLFTLLAFQNNLFDRKFNQEGEAKILAVLRDVAQ